MVEVLLLKLESKSKWYNVLNQDKASLLLRLGFVGALLLFEAQILEYCQSVGRVVNRQGAKTINRRYFKSMKYGFC